MDDDAERLSPDDLASWQALLAEADGAQRALETLHRHFGRKYQLGPTRRLRADGVIDVAGAETPAP